MARPPAFSDRIVAWQQTHGRHDLPWQGSNPYHVWLSEIMLQQTQVVKVIDYFDRFITALPDLRALAAADEQQVLALWSGLGYYNRARYLHRSAQLCVEKHQGLLPQSMDDLVALPGIGRSTAAAIMSLAFDQAEPIMDGNVKRVFARQFKVSGDPNSGPVVKRFWELAEANKTQTNPGVYTQGLMDLGALVCTKHNPNCNRCPVANTCQAKVSGEVKLYPQKKAKTKTKAVTLYALLSRQKDQVLLAQRDAKGIWPQLWFLPTFDDESALLAANPKAVHRFTITHKLTHRHLSIPVYETSELDSDLGSWVKNSALEHTPHPKALNHILEQHNNENDSEYNHERNHHLH